MEMTAAGNLSAQVRDKEIIGLVHMLANERDAQKIMDIVRHEARRLLKTDGVTFVLRDGDHCYYAEEDAISPLWKGMRFPMTHCISGWAMLNHKSVAIKNIYEDSRIPHDAYRLTFVRSLIMVPVRSEDPIAAIGAYWSDEHVADPEELTTLETIANAAAVALTNVGLIHSLHSMVEQLQQRNKELDLAYRARASFLGNMSHELRTPLNVIMGLSDTMSREFHGPLGDRYKSYATEIKESGTNLLKLVNDMLDLAAIGSGSCPIAVEPVQLDKVIEACIHLVEKRVEEAQLKLTNMTSPFLPAIQGDPRILNQMILNILLNAIKFTPKDGEIIIKAEAKGNEISCSITDTGIGMTPKEIEEATRPFQQADEGLSRRFQGAGLGLALCKGYIDLHGGQMRIDSAPGQGTTVTFTFPVGK